MKVCTGRSRKIVHLIHKPLQVIPLLVIAGTDPHSCQSNTSVQSLPWAGFSLNDHWQPSNWRERGYFKLTFISEKTQFLWIVLDLQYKKLPIYYCMYN